MAQKKKNAMLVLKGCKFVELSRKKKKRSTSQHDKLRKKDFIPGKDVSYDTKKDLNECIGKTGDEKEGWSSPLPKEGAVAG